MRFIYIISAVTLSMADMGLFAQNAVVSTGGDIQSGKGAISYSVGQVDYLNTASSEGTLAAGVQQPVILKQEISHIDENGMKSAIQVKVYPNPVHNVCNIKVDNEQCLFTYKINDMAGKEVTNGKFTSETQIQFSKYPQGVYMLLLTPVDRVKETVSFKLIKVQ